MEAMNDTKQVFKQCGTCSQTFAHLLNREFAVSKDAEIRASDPLAGGLFNTGHQCGMIWGTALAIGTEAYRRHQNLEEATAVAITATQHIIDSFEKRSQTISCREITGCKLDSVYGLVKFMIKIQLKGMMNSTCFNLAEKWAPEAIQTATKDLDNPPIALTQKPLSCASEVVRQMGGSQEEMAMVSGFAGGLGLKGSACGALSAAIWMRTLQWCRANPGKNPPYFNNSSAKRLLAVFKKFTNNEMECSVITNMSFADVNEHTEFIANGGCQELMKTLANTQV